MQHHHTGDRPSPRRQPHPRRTHYPNLSPTRAPAVAADAELWPAWTRQPIERLGFVLVNDAGAIGGGH